MLRPPPNPTLFPYTTLFRSFGVWGSEDQTDPFKPVVDTFNSLSESSDVTLRRYASHDDLLHEVLEDRKSTRLNSSHMSISYAVFCLKKKTKRITRISGTRHT